MPRKKTTRKKTIVEEPQVEGLEILASGADDAPVPEPEEQPDYEELV